MSIAQKVINLHEERMSELELTLSNIVKNVRRFDQTLIERLVKYSSKGISDKIDEKVLLRKAKEVDSALRDARNGLNTINGMLKIK